MHLKEGILAFAEKKYQSGHGAKSNCHPPNTPSLFSKGFSKVIIVAIECKTWNIGIEKEITKMHLLNWDSMILVLILIAKYALSQMLG